MCVAVYNDVVNNDKFMKFERECEKDPRSSLLNLTDILIMPVQRVPRYQMLFEVLNFEYFIFLISIQAIEKDDPKNPRRLRQYIRSGRSHH